MNKLIYDGFDFVIVRIFYLFLGYELVLLFYNEVYKIYGGILILFLVIWSFDRKDVIDDRCFLVYL